MKIALTSARGIIQYGQACLEQEARRRTKCSPCWSLDIQLLCPPDASAPVSQALASGLNPIPAVLAFSPCRWQVMALLSHCIYGSQLLLYVVSNVHTHTDWFCFSREPWLSKSCQKEEDFGESHAGYEILKPNETPMPPAYTSLSRASVLDVSSPRARPEEAGNH